ncbi:hypothetical protein OCU04_004825 [Sclerotinia nivalis]|uniref:NACHT domain-containing protein n=1 Tax=Sclerotinia nivalis TaxID=352851 RepID=A0A9X0AR87_9HELO|nr:hypothetical protein OCU04_004825 [Sclerotinia nivalis]
MAASDTLASIDMAFMKLKQSVDSVDAVNFQSTTLEDVWKAALAIQQHQRENKSMRNIRRIEPFLKALEKYSQSIEILCNGTPYLPWIWAPIKLLLQLASAHANIFEKLLNAYAQIAESMPRFDRLQKTFQDHPDFQRVLAMVYCDILEFHTCAYRLFRRRVWHVVIDSLWKDFDSRFSGILESLSRHRDLIDREASSINIAEARSARVRAEEDVARREKERQNYQLKDSITWLAITNEEQQDIIEQLLRRRQSGTGEWLLQNPQIMSWISDSRMHPVIWLKGIPGGGKSVLCVHLIEALTADQKYSLIYYFCDSTPNSKNICTEILKSLTLQLLQANIELASHVADKYASSRPTATLAQVRKVLPELIATIPATRIIIDGLDECRVADQKSILNELLRLMKLSGDRCKLLVSSRENACIQSVLGKKPTISLSEHDQRASIDIDIRLHVHEELIKLRERFDPAVIDEVEKIIVNKATGMFLYVRLVLAELEGRFSVKQLFEATQSLPEGLDEAYGRILQRINNSNDFSRRTSVRILKWMACSYRKLKPFELQDGLAFYPGNTVLDDSTKLSIHVLDQCKPLIEQGPSGAIDFVHFSAREYILHPGSGPYLQESHAHFDMAFSCVSYLLSSMCLISPSIKDFEAENRIIKGYHGLHRYAHEFWIDHLLRFSLSKLCDSPADTEALVQQVDYLSQSQKPLTKLYDNPRANSNDVHSGSHEHLLSWSQSPNIQQFLEKVLVFRKVLEQERSSTNSPEELERLELEMDPTSLSQLSNRYNSISGYLLRSSDLLHQHDSKLLQCFKEIYGTSGYPCRYQCKIGANGFVSIEERDQHEAYHHIKIYRCGEMSCDLSVRGFNTKAAMQKHTTLHHSKATDEPAPILRRKIAMQLKKAALEKEDSEAAGNALAEFDLKNLPENQENVGSDWSVTFNPEVPRVLDIDLLHNLQHESVVCSVRFSYDGKYVATGSNRVAQIFDVNTGQNICILQDELIDPVNENYIRSVCFSPDGRYLATGAEDKLIRIWDIASKSIKNTFAGHEDEIYSIDFASDGRTIASGSSDRTVRLWDIETGLGTLVLKIEDGILTVAISPDTKYVVAGGLDNWISIWDTVTGYLVERLEGPDGHKDSVFSVAFALNGKYLVSGSLDKTIKMWELAPREGKHLNNTSESGRCIKTLEGHKDFVLTTTFTADGKWILSGSKDKEIQLWDVQTGNSQLILQGHKGSVISIAASPRGGCFATDGGDMSAKIWSYKMI